jgi:hypothetical protein
VPDALYEPDGEAFVSTELTRGPWSREHQHAGPPSALLAHAIEAAAGIEAGQLTRIAVDILRPVPIAPLHVRARHLRPGRRVEQIEATLTLAADGTELMRATAWRMRLDDVALPAGIGTPDPPPPGPEGLDAAGRPSFFRDDVAYFAALEWRFFSGGFDTPGPAGCWTRLRVPLVAGEPATPVEHLLVMGDAASGLSATLDWTRYSFMNVDFTVHLERPPAGDWLAMDAVTRPRSTGAGLSTSVVSDATGRVGVSAQSLLVGANA